MIDRKTKSYEPQGTDDQSPQSRQHRSSGIHFKWQDVAEEQLTAKNRNFSPSFMRLGQQVQAADGADLVLPHR